MSGNYPPGTWEGDPRAPWNQDEERPERDIEIRYLRCKECGFVGDRDCFEGEPDGCVVCNSTDYEIAGTGS